MKYWDADKFEPLLTLAGHHAAAWCLAVSQRGEFVVTGGHDRSIRVWERTDEPFFVDEEKERRLESLLEDGGAGEQDDGDDDRVAAAARDAAAAKGGAAPAGKGAYTSRLTLVPFSAHHKHFFLREELGGVSVTISFHNTTQAELKRRRV